MMKIKNRLNNRVVFYFLLLIPFFKLESLELFKKQHFYETFFSQIDLLLDLLRVVGATYGFYLLLKKGFQKIKKHTFILIALFIIELIVCVLNKSFDLFIFIKIYSYIGFILFLNYTFDRYDGELIRALIKFFELLSILGIITSIFFPMGFLHAQNIYNAIFLFGGKNTSFPFYYMCLLVMYLTWIKNNKKNKLKNIWCLPLILMIIAVIICHSVNSLLGLILIGIISLLYVTIKPKINIYLTTFLMFLALSLIYIGVNFRVIQNILLLFGRNSTFSSRTGLWEQAIKNFADNPLIGAGYKISYVLGFHGTDHAHSWYLDTLSKYGIIPLILFLFLIIITLQNLGRIRYKPLQSFLCLFLLIYLLHMGFDVYNANFYILIFMIINYYPVYNNNS